MFRVKQYGGDFKDLYSALSKVTDLKLIALNAVKWKKDNK